MIRKLLKWSAVLMITLPVSFLTGLALASFCPLERAKPFQRTAFESVVAAISQGTLKPDGSGVVALPRDAAHLSATGRVYVSHGPNGELIVFFPSWVGRDTLLISPLDVSG